MRHLARVSVGFVCLLTATIVSAQQSSRSDSVPRVMHISGVVAPANGKSAGSVETVTLAIYAEEKGGTPLWEETQQVAVDSNGRYSVLLGATRPDGLPLDLFASGEARWLGRRFERGGEPEQARVLLASVPYALKAADTDTLGGRPASDYLLSRSAVRGAATGSGQELLPGPLDILPGAVNGVPKYYSATDLGVSSMFDIGGLVGVGTQSPLDAMHLKFTNTTGTMTGLAVQNMGSNASSYSGMLFYDHTGALGQFQGFNNSTHEYRINNVASSGTINFMLGSTSKFKVSSQFVDVFPGDITGRLIIGSIAQGSPDFSGNLGVAGDGNGLQGVAMFDRLNDDGTLVRFRRNGTTQGTIDVAAGVVSYNAFTGSHYARTDETIERGMLVSLTGKNGRLEDKPESEIIYGVAKTRRANDPAILGAYLARQNSTGADVSDTLNPHLVEAVGNGEMWVIDTGRDLVPGDYLVSSGVAGHGMIDPGTFAVSYVVARVAEPINWKDITASVPAADGRTHKRALVSVSFENFVIDRTRSLETDAELVRLRNEIASLTAQLTALIARDEARDARLAQLENGQDKNAARTGNGVIDPK